MKKFSSIISKILDFLFNEEQEQRSNDYDIALEFVLKIEGNESYDKWGGDTCFGITERYYPKQHKEIKTLKTREERVQYARIFYKKEFWDKANCDQLEYPLNIVVFDTAVNMGIPTAMKIEKLRTEIKPRNEESLMYLALRMFAYADIVNRNKKKRKFLVGWLNRCKELWRINE